MSKPLGRLSVLLLMVRRSLRQHLLSTCVTIGAAALASGLVMATFSIASQSEEAFSGGDLGFDAVVGARGSELQLVLNAVFHLDTSPGNVSWHLYEELAEDSRVDLAVPTAVGDNYRGFRVVGTTESFFTELHVQRGRTLDLQDGRVFDPELREAVIGRTVAKATGLRVGGVFQPGHGLTFNEGHDHDEEYTVVGVLEGTNSAVDRVLWIPLEGMHRMSGHVLRGAGEDFQAHDHPHEEIPEEHLEVSAILLKLAGHQAGFQLSQEINRQGKEATFAWPLGRAIGELFDKLGFVNRILELVAYLVMIVAAASILASIYNTMNERRREFAVLRALGARRRTVSAVILLEAGAIALLGALFGLLVYAALHLVAARLVEARTGVVLDLLHFHPALVLAPLAMVALGVLAGLLPARNAYATQVSENLVT